MVRDEQLKSRWEILVEKLSQQFADGDTLDLDAIIYLIGVQELGQFDRKYKKDHKLILLSVSCWRLMDTTSLIMLMKMVGHITKQKPNFLF